MPQTYSLKKNRPSGKKPAAVTDADALKRLPPNAVLDEVKREAEGADKRASIRHGPRGR